MQKLNSKHYINLIFCLIIILIGSSKAEAFENSVLYIQTQDGQEHKFNIEIAITKEEKHKGLMFQKYIAKNYGMLFLFETEKIVSMWMKNTIISLDMIFINDKQKIVHIVHDTKPYDTKTISSITPVIAVLEIAAGVAKKIGIKKGDAILLQDKT